MGLRDRFLFKDFSCFFVTTTCNNWFPLIDQSNSYEVLEQSLSFTCEKYAASILGYVIMPNHLHLILYFQKENELSNFMRDFKKFTSVKIRQGLENEGKIGLVENLRIEAPNRVFKVWMERFDDVYINSKELLEIKLNYIHNNPLQEKWNLVLRPEDYRYSSASFYEKGIQPELMVTDYREFF